MTDDAYMRLLGIETVSVSAGEAVLRAEVRAEHINIHGTAHGGFLYSVADVAFELASNSHGVQAVGLTTHMEYARAVKLGDTITAHASEAYVGRRTGTYQIRLTVEDKLVALFTGTVFRIS